MRWFDEGISDSIGENIGDFFDYGIGENVGDCFGKNVGDCVSDGIGNSVGDCVSVDNREEGGIGNMRIRYRPLAAAMTFP